MADKDITDTMMDAMFYAVAFAAAVVGLAPVFQRILAATPAAQYFQAQTYEGRPYAKVHNASETLSWRDLIHEWPYTPLMNVFLINDGPDAVEVAINYPNERYIIQPNETRTITRTGAEERIAVIFFICGRGETATVRVEGEY
ncbi:MAG: hypothetical protein PHU08_05140 [Dehalococcoidales bacterium]|nr:hypothetical protein [Dehalococcoidales bacterium]